MFEQLTMISHSQLQYAANYEFGYRIRDYDHGNDYGHKESKDGETTKGEYHALLPDGRMQTVSYYVDDSGYHAEVTYGGESTQHWLQNGGWWSSNWRYVEMLKSRAIISTKTIYYFPS